MQGAEAQERVFSSKRAVNAPHDGAYAQGDRGLAFGVAGGQDSQGARRGPKAGPA